MLSPKCLQILENWHAFNTHRILYRTSIDPCAKVVDKDSSFENNNFKQIIINVPFTDPPPPHSLLSSHKSVSLQSKLLGNTCRI